MSKTKITILTVLAFGVTSIVVIQQRQLSRVTVANQELQHQLEQTLGERDEVGAANERLRSAATRAQSEANELARLRGDVTRLRRALVSGTNSTGTLGASREISSAPPDLRETRLTPFTGTARAALAPGQAMVMGGWPTEAGKRTLALLTPEVDADGNVRIRSTYVQMPEAVLAGPGWEQFQAVTNDASVCGVFTPEQAQQFTEALKAMEGVDVLSSPQVITKSGHQASISIGEGDDSGLSVTLLPVVSADGRSVDFSISNSLQRLR